MNWGSPEGNRRCEMDSKKKQKIRSDLGENLGGGGKIELSARESNLLSSKAGGGKIRGGFAKLY